MACIFSGYLARRKIISLVFPLQAWPSVVNTITNETTLDYLDGIKNLTEEAQQHNATVPIVIQTFIDQASTAGYDSFMYLQTQLLIALKSVQYEYGCLADKQHAVTTVINDCRAGREPFPDLYEYALTKHKLNRDGCIAKGMIPYTSQEQFEEILNDAAEHFKFYPNCLLNNEDLLYRVCAEEVQGKRVVHIFIYSSHLSPQEFPWVNAEF